MSPRWILPTVVSQSCAEELALSRKAERRDELPTAWRHFQRAHILGQTAVWAHIWVHLTMLRFAVVHWNRREIVGQLVRIVIAGPGSYSGRVPLGDTGAARAPFPPAPIPEDLRVVLQAGDVAVPPVAGRV
ncbi:MAG: DUF3703 domain-containing protein [Nocardioidaceae bacterium]